MKKIFYFLLLMLSGVVWGQTDPDLHQINPNQLNFNNLGVASKNIQILTNLSCPNNSDSPYIGFYYFKAENNLDLNLRVTANNNLNSDFKLFTWNIIDTNNNGIPNEVFEDNTTKRANRSIYGNQLTKGLYPNESLGHNCEFYNGDGKVRGLIGDERINKDTYVVIAIMTSIATDTFDLSLGIAESHTMNDFINYKCIGDSISYEEIVDKLRSQPNILNTDIISLYADSSFNTIINDTEVFSTDRQIYALVKDSTGNLKYIFTIPISFKTLIGYSVQNATEQFCAPSKSFTRDYIISKVLPSINSSKYADYEVYVDNVKVSGNITLNNSNNYSIKLKYIGTEFCPEKEFSDEVELRLENSNPTLPTGRFREVCNAEILSEDEILTALGVDVNNFKLVNPPPTTYTFVGNEFKFQVQIVDRTDGACVSNQVEFTVKKKPNVDLDNLTLTFCRSDFSFSEFQRIVNDVKKNDEAVDLEINYDGVNYNEVQLQSLYDLIRRTTTQTDFNLSINGNKAGFCESTVLLKITLNPPSIPTTPFEVLFNPGCLGVTEDYTFSILYIENYIKAKLGTNIVIADNDGNPLTSITLTPNSSQTLSFKARGLTELCWSELMTLDLQTINQPNVVSATLSDEFCEGETLTIDDNLLRDNFGSNVFDYKIFIEGVEYIRGNPVQRELDFGGNTSLNISVEFKNRLSDTCSTTIDLSINKKDDLVVDVDSLETYTFTNEIIYCEGEDENAKNQIEAILKHINSQEPGLVVKSTIDEIFAQIDSNEGFVNVVFEDPNYCGTATIKFYFKRNPLPTITVPEEVDPLCFNELYSLDFTTQTDYNKYTYIVEKVGGTRINGVDKFELDAGIYNITIEDKITGCSIVKTLDVKNAETPTIEKITINKTSIIVTAKGNGKLEYALFGSDGNIIVYWQTKNELIIPDKIADNNFTVKVRLNGCGVFERKDVIYLVLPNVVTPNQDGKNDVWKPMTKNGKINDVSNSYKLIIFDRYGKQILSKEGIGIIEWDGTHNGKPVADGTYWYLLESNEELQVLYSGYIVVKRKIN
ncbi:gliding motility-associated C-terminal domain-containing protein [Empedobacter falsenii]